MMMIRLVWWCDDDLITRHEGGWLEEVGIIFGKKQKKISFCSIIWGDVIHVFKNIFLKDTFLTLDFLGYVWLSFYDDYYV